MSTVAAAAPVTKMYIDIFYEKLKCLVEELTKEELVNNYSEAHDGTKKGEQFQEKIGEISNYSNLFDRLKNEKKVFTDFDTLEQIITDLYREFTDYSTLDKEVCDTLLSICRKIATLIVTEEFPDDSFETSQFELIRVDEALVGRKISISNYLYDKKPSVENHLMVITPKDDFLSFIQRTNYENLEDFLFIFLDKVQISNDFVTGKFVLLHSNYKENIKSILSFIELHYVSLGGEIHNSQVYPHKPTITSSINADISKNYHQFSEVLYILSEYNSQKDILDKYLKIYQVIENFMFRYPVCNLVNKLTPAMFSIRDFRRLYKRVEKDEILALDDLIEHVFNEIDYNSTTKFKKFVLDKWTSLDSTKVSEINDALSKLSVSSKKGDYTHDKIDNNNIIPFYTKLVYMVRNSIVHNKETEYHLTSNNLLPGIIYILENFLLITTEEIVFNLIMNHNNLVWYKHPELYLFR